MIFTDDFCKRNIFIDTDDGYELGQDQAYDSFPIVFPVVNFELICTDALIEQADRVRRENGHHAPLDDGWYNFYISINGLTKTQLDNGITFTVNSDTADDDFAAYSIDLDEAEQTAVFNRLDELCRSAFKKTCAELLDDARKEMEG